MGSNCYKDQFQGLLSITKERAEQITGLSFSTEDLKDCRLRVVIISLGRNEELIQTKEAYINHLEKQLDYYRSVDQTNNPSKSISKKSNPERSRPFLSVVS